MHDQNQTTASNTYIGNVEYAKPPHSGVIEEFDRELEALDETIKRLDSALGPVLSQYASADVRGPEPEPSSQIRGRVMRLTHLRATLNEMIARLDL